MQKSVGGIIELTGGTFQEEVPDLLANDEHGVVLAIHYPASTEGLPHLFQKVAVPGICVS